MTDLQRARGYRFAGLHAGIKVARKDLALIVSEPPAQAAATLTPNQVRAACVDRAARLLPQGELTAIVIDSGNANCRSGPDEVAHDERMAAAVARSLEVPPQRVLTASTGPIGVPLPVERIEAAVPRLLESLGEDPASAAEAILTTDTAPKLASRRVELPGGAVTLTAIAKGSGMIHPQMATMLAFLCTDAACPAGELQDILREAVAATFNQVSVDRDTSTNDMCVLLANGAAGVAVTRADAAFVEAVHAVCEELARAIAADGEGATRLVEVEVRGAPDLESARALSRAAVESNLFKCSLFGDQNGWSRALAALGARAARRGLTLARERVALFVDDEQVVAEGRPTGTSPQVRRPEVRFRVELGLGEAAAKAWGCDFSYDYVSINAVTKADRLETHSPGLKRRLLVEALGYIRRFSGRLAVIKYGGAAMVKDSLKDAFAEDLVLLEAAGLRPVVVHGGGPEISRTLGELGQETRFEDGMRVTDETSMRVVEMVLTGRVNTDVVTRINAQGGRAIGLSGKDGSLLTARKLEVAGKDYGLVGEVEEVKSEVVTMLLERSYIPVISPVGVDRRGVTYNVNADVVAAAVAVALGAEKLIFLSDVPGLLDGSRLLSQITPAEAEDLIARGVVRGGMLPKTRALLSAIRGGVPSAHIIDGRVPHNLLAELFTESGVGTWIRGESPAGA